MTRSPEADARIATAKRAAAWLRQHGAEVSHYASRAAFGDRPSLKRIAEIGEQLRTYCREELAR